MSAPLTASQIAVAQQLGITAEAYQAERDKMYPDEYADPPTLELANGEKFSDNRWPPMKNRYPYEIPPRGK